MPAASPRIDIIYAHGTNGSGKSTLARALIKAAGGVIGVNYSHNNRHQTYTHTKAGVILIGKYGNACGGVDGVSPYSAAIDTTEEQVALWSRQVFLEGLATPGLATCQRIASMGNALFIFLDTPVDQCITNVLKRREARGTTKPYDPANLHKKQRSVESWAARCAQAGLQVERLSWDNAYTRILRAYNLKRPKEIL